jgi:CubicO group peptidase (beta-lactamase class C family)
MKSWWWWAIGGALALSFAAWMAGGDHPRRTFTGIVHGTDALAYLPPRREVSLTAGPPQPTLSLAEAELDPGSVEVARHYAATRNTHALVIGVNGHIVHQEFRDGLGLDSPADLSDFTPVLAALVLGTAQQNGEIRDLDAPLARFFPEWAGDPRGTITLRELLTGNSNLAAPGGRPWPGSRAASYFAGENLGGTLLAWPQAERTGPAGSPPQVDADILSKVLAAALKESYESLLAERLWKPLGGGSFSVGLDGEDGAATHVRAGCCLRASIGDWMRVGALIANRGVFEGNQLLPPGYADLLVTRTHKDSARAVFLRADGQFAARDLVWLAAAGKQRLWMVPSLKLVILRIGEEPPAGAGWDEAMIPDSIIRGLRGSRPAGAVEGGKVDPERYAPH